MSSSNKIWESLFMRLFQIICMTVRGVNHVDNNMINMMQERSRPERVLRLVPAWQLRVDFWIYNKIWTSPCWLRHSQKNSKTIGNLVQRVHCRPYRLHDGQLLRVILKAFNKLWKKFYIEDMEVLGEPTVKHLTIMSELC